MEVSRAKLHAKKNQPSFQRVKYYFLLVSLAFTYKKNKRLLSFNGFVIRSKKIFL